jgi:hypothetical protein
MAVTAVEKLTTTTFAGERSFGAGGVYNLIRGVARFEVDPTAKANERITDLELADRDEAGLVHFDADFCVLEPADPARSNGRLCFVVNNRGRAAAVPFSVGARPVAATEIDPGDGYLLERGWTIAWCGWQWDMLAEPGLLGLRAPEAKIDGQSLTGQVRVDFRAEVPIRDHPLADTGALYAFQAYPASDLDQRDAVLTVRSGVSTPPTVIDRNLWAFAHDEDGTAVPDATSVWLAGGFDAHRFYELIYRTNRSPVVGVGLLATRDFVSFLRNGSTEPIRPTRGPIEYAFGHGVSQTGRYLRHFVYEGLNVDESDQVVFDGILPHIAGARRGEFNARFGQPSHIGFTGVAVLPPYAIDEEPGLFDLQRRLGGVPKMIATNTSWEYWRSDACLNHIDPADNRDRVIGSDHRFYALAGIDHMGDNPMKAMMKLANPTNPLGYLLLLRAALENLVSWVVDGTEPPPSRVPHVSDHSASTREDVLKTFAGLPGTVLADAELLPTTRPADFGDQIDAGIMSWPPREGAPFTCFVASIDDDGNETAGVRLPEVAVPVATYTGWNSPDTGPTGEHALKEFAGSSLRFPRTAEEREATNDPRLSIAERYASRSEYERLARLVAAELVTGRLLLAEDEELAVASALAAYDAAIAS